MDIEERTCYRVYHFRGIEGRDKEWICQDCGLIVGLTYEHAVWHDRMEKK